MIAHPFPEVQSVPYSVECTDTAKASDGKISCLARRGPSSVSIRYRISSATVSIFMWCSRQNLIKSGTRAIVPSSFMISQITPAGRRPAILARSTDASVCPARTNTPLRARARETHALASKYPSMLFEQRSQPESCARDHELRSPWSRLPRLQCSQ